MLTRWKRSCPLCRRNQTNSCRRCEARFAFLPQTTSAPVAAGARDETDMVKRRVSGSDRNGADMTTNKKDEQSRAEFFCRSEEATHDDARKTAPEAVPSCEGYIPFLAHLVCRLPVLSTVLFWFPRYHVCASQPLDITHCAFSRRSAGSRSSRLMRNINNALSFLVTLRCFA